MFQGQNKLSKSDTTKVLREITAASTVPELLLPTNKSPYDSGLPVLGSEKEKSTYPTLTYSCCPTVSSSSRLFGDYSWKSEPMNTHNQQTWRNLVFLIKTIFLITHLRGMRLKTLDCDLLNPHYRRRPGRIITTLQEGDRSGNSCGLPAPLC